MMDNKEARAFVVLNPVAGQSDTGRIRRVLERRLSEAGWSYEVHETKEDERIAEVVRDALDREFDIFAAAGGDGTVSGVAGGLVRTGIPLGIIPVGTGNTLARELGVPLDLEGAVDLLVNPHATTSIDAMQAYEDQYFFLNVGIGLTALMMRNTDYREKRRLGQAAYVWHGLKALIGLHPHRFTIVTDGQTTRLRASEVLIANSGAIGKTDLRWGDHIHLDDGQIDVCIVRANTITDYIRAAWQVLLGRQRQGSHIHYRRAGRRIRVSAEKTLPVQGDGDAIGQTPVEVQVVPGGLEVIVPAYAQGRRRVERAERKRS